jgi:hypothetical protein
MKSCQVHNIKFSNLQTGKCLCHYSLQSSVNGRVLFFADDSKLFIISVEKIEQDINGCYIIPHISTIEQAFNKLK